MNGYQNDALAELARQLSAGVLRLRKGYVDTAEALAKIIDPDSEYPLQFVVYRLTGYRPARYKPIRPMTGRSVRHDLRRLILDLCDSFDVPARAYGEAVYDTEGVARRFRVSTKTVQRWRARGLVARRLVFDDGRKRIAFLESSLRDFASRRRRDLLRSARFSQMSDAEREEIIRRAKRMVDRTGCCLHEASRRLAARTGRAVETIRYTIRRHDRERPAEAVFPNMDAPLDDAAKEVIYRCFLHGVPVASLAKRYGRTRGSVYRIINDMRARHLLSRKIEYVHNPQFDLPGAEETLCADEPPPADAKAPARSRRQAPSDLPAYLKALYDVPLLTREQERHLFRQYNYLKHRADQLRRDVDLNRVRSAVLRRIERLLVQADAIKGRIIRANLRLVVSIAKKHLHGPQGLFELISDGNVSLMRAVEKFDYSRGFKFSTYASWAIMKNFARSVPKERYLLDRFRTGTEEIVDLAAGLRTYDPRATSLAELREVLDVVLAQLSSRERSIIVGHYGLMETRQPQTLEQMSQRLGISKERVRQIERKAMKKLHTLLEPGHADLMR